MDDIVFPNNFTREIYDEPNEEIIHLRIKNRNQKKCVTIVEGLNSELDIPRMFKLFRKTFCCNGNIINDNNSVIIQLTGDQRENVRNFLVREQLYSNNCITIHGY